VASASSPHASRVGGPDSGGPFVPRDERLQLVMTDAAHVPRLRACAVLAGLGLAATACLPRGLAFVQDKRVDIFAPQSHTTVNLPVTIRWRVHGFRITGHTGSSDPDAGYFGVFVDRAPVPPGKPLSWVAHGDRQCEATQGCPDAGYFHDHDTYWTTGTSMTFHQLPDQSAYHGHELHEVTIVLLDGRGIRVGESAWCVDFRYNRQGL